jgi:hypothetical protein
VGQDLAGSIRVAPGNLPNAVTAGATVAEHDVAFQHPLGNGPHCSTREPRRDSRLVGPLFQVDRDEFLVERTPFIGQPSGEVLVDAEVRADETAGEA